MSSHHIVREKQEPALLVLAFEYEQEEMLGQLLEWSPTVAVTPSVFDKINSLGIKIDLCFGKAEIINNQPEIKNIQLKNTSQYIQYFVDNSYPALTILGTKADLSSLTPFVNSLDLVLITEWQKIIPLKNTYQKWLPKGKIMEIIKGDNAEFNWEGLNPIDNHQFVTTEDGIIYFEYKKGSIFIAEYI